jgi:Fic family protein
MSIPYDKKLEQIYEKIIPKFFKEFENVEETTLFNVQKLEDEIGYYSELKGNKNVEEILQFYFLYESYIAEICDENHDDIQQIIEDIMTEEKPLISSTPQKIIWSIKNALDYVIKQNITEFSLDLIFELHKQICEGLEIETGKFRQKMVCPYGSSIHTYLHHNLIEEKLKTLCEFINVKLGCISDGNYSGIIKLATIFLHQFCVIHPFPDGNGRLGRVLTQIIFNKIISIPVSLFCGSRRKFIKAIETVDERTRHIPHYFYGHMVECVNSHIQKLCDCV